VRPGVSLALVALLSLSLAGCAKDAAPPVDDAPAEQPTTTEAPVRPALPGVTAPPPAPPAPTASLPAPTRLIPVGEMATEPSLAIADDGTVFYQAYERTLRSRDGGATWEPVFDLNEEALYHTASADPYVHVDPRTQRVFVLHMAGLYCNTLAHSDDGGDTWLMREIATCATPVVDHPKIATGPWHEPRPPGLLYGDAVYLCYNKIVAGPFCAVSLDGGLTFQSERLVQTGNCGASPGQLAAGPDGTVYVPFAIACDRPHVAVSQDNGLTWTVRDGPPTGSSQDIDPDIAVAPDGTAWMEWQGGDNLRYVTRSRDQFVTWEGPWIVSTSDLRSTAQGTIVAGPAGVAVAYFGTRDSDAVPREAPENTTWHLFLAHAAASGDPSWSVLQLSSDPVQRGCIWELSGPNRDCRNMGDFFDMAVDGDGHPVVAFVDGCEDECAVPQSDWPGQSSGDQGWLAWVDGVGVGVS
jgi:hypothetical protein